MTMQTVSIGNTSDDTPNVHFSSASDDWPTPTEYFARLSKLFNFTLDPCSSASNAKCSTYFTPDQDGLAQSWQTSGAVFMNPPYGKERPLFPLKQLERAHSLVCFLAESQSLWQDPLSFHDRVYVFGHELQSQEGFVSFNMQKWQQLIQDRHNILAVNNPLPSDPFVELSRLLTVNCAAPEQAAKILHGRLVSHLDLHIQAIGVAMGLGLTGSPRLTLVDAYTAFTINETGGPSDIANPILHPSLLACFADYIKDCMTVKLPGIGKWVKKAYEESRKGTPVVCLLPARTDTAWWQDYCTKGQVKFIRGRLKFGDATNSAPFPSAIVIFANLDNSELDTEQPNLFTAV